MPRKKKKQPEEPLDKATPEEQLPLEWPMDVNDLRREKDDIEHISRMLNIKYDNPDVKTITKTVVYDCVKKQIIKGNYKAK